jgi:hypothetical protein
LGLLALSLLLAAGFVEIGLRVIFGSPVHFRYPQERYVAEPAIGHWLEPDQRTFTHDAIVETNSVGLRGPERARELGPGQCRILALGDSQTFGDGLEHTETWPALLESALADIPGIDEVQVLNAGISGTDTWQHEHVLRRLAEHYEYDSVVLAFYVNDVTPRYAPRQATRLTNTSTKRIGYALKRSALFTFLWQLYQMRVSDSGVVERERRTLEDDPDETLERAWEQVEESLRGIQNEAAARGAEFVLVVLPRRDQVSAENPPRGYNRRLASITARLGIPSIDVLESLRAAYDRHGSSLFIPWNGHNTGQTNALVVQRLVDEFGGHALCGEPRGHGIRTATPREPGPVR